MTNQVYAMNGCTCICKSAPNVWLLFNQWQKEFPARRDVQLHLQVSWQYELLRPTPPPLILIKVSAFYQKSDYVFTEMKLGGLIPNSYVHVSLSDLYIFRIGLPIWLQ